MIKRATSVGAGSVSMTTAIRPGLLSLFIVALAAGCGPGAQEQVSAPAVAPYSACAPHVEVSTANAVLTPGDCIISANGQYVLAMRSTGDLDLIGLGGSGDTIIWSSHSSGGPANSRHLGIQTDGNLVMYDEQGAAVWASGSTTTPGRFILRVDDAGVAQFIADSGTVAWSVPQ
jgi:hypothetical protein